MIVSLWQSRTVEADLGMRWNAVGITEAAGREHLPVPDGLEPNAESLVRDPGHLPADSREVAFDLDLARAAAVVAVRRHARHGRPGSPGAATRPLGDVGLVLGSGGVLRHASAERGMRVLTAVTGDHAGGWRVPRSARTGVDAAYLLFAVGLLAEDHPELARAVVRTLEPVVAARG